MRGLAGAAIVLCLGTGAAAQTRPAGGDDLSLSRGTWTAQTYAAYAGANNESLPSANVGIGYHVLDNLSLNLEGAAYSAFQDGPDAAAGEIRLMLRHHLFTRRNYSIFADVGEGFFEASEDVPEGGTRFNFVFRAGLGAAYALDDNTWLIGGVRYWHLSNAKLEGADRNPSLNGIEGYVGIMWTWK